jgi:hypothetical protein
MAAIGGCGLSVLELSISASFGTFMTVLDHTPGKGGGGGAKRESFLVLWRKYSRSCSIILYKSLQHGDWPQ